MPEISQVLKNRMTPSVDESEIKLQFTQQVPSDWTLGTDVSHWQGFIDWEQMAEKEVDFSITKATDFYSSMAKGFVDTKAFVNLAGMEENGFVTGGYCWLQPKQDPKLQAEFYVNEFYSKVDVDFPPVLDFEDNNVISWNDMLWRAQVWLEIVEEKTGRTPIVYTSPGYMMNFDRTKSGFLSRYPLWIAHYIQRNYPTIPHQWDDWMIWQYSDRGHYPYYIYQDPNSGYGKEYGVGSYGLDMNWYKGTLSDLHNYVGLEEKPTPTPTPTPEPEEGIKGYAKVIAWVLSVRSGAGVSHPVIRYLRKGDVEPIFEVKNGWYRINKDEWVSGSWMQKIAVPDYPKPVEPPESDELFEVRCVAYALYKRSGPSISFSTIGHLTKGDIVSVYEEKSGWYKIDPNKEVWISSNWTEKV